MDYSKTITIGSGINCIGGIHVYVNSNLTCQCGEVTRDPKDFSLGAASYGWICPACGRSNAPSVHQCSCPGKLQSESSTTGPRT